MVSTISNITVDTYWADADQPLLWPGNWNFITNFVIPALAGSSEAVSSVEWEVPFGFQEFGLLIRADALDDPIGSGPDTVFPVDNVENNNNIAQRNFSLRSPLLFSPDIPAQIGDQLFREYEIIFYAPGPEIFPFYSAGQEGANIDACDLFEEYNVYSMDVSSEWDLGEVREFDLAGYRSNGVVQTMLFLDGQGVGIPEGADIDAAMVLPDGGIVFSLDIPAVVAGIPFSQNDLILYNGLTVDELFRGEAAGIPDSANIDGVYLIEDMDDDGVPSPGGGYGSEVLFSLDIPAEINGIAFTERDIIRCGEPPCSKYNDELSSVLSMSVDVDAFALITDNCPEHYNPGQQDLDEDGRGDPCDECTDTDEDGYGNPGFPNVCEEDNCPVHHNPEQEDSYPPGGNNCGDACECEGNFDGDEDQDGSDAFTFKVDFGRSPFGNPCIPDNPCNGNFNCDEDVDGSDAFIFKEDFGRSPFLNPCPNCVTTPWCE